MAVVQDCFPKLCVSLSQLAADTSGCGTATVVMAAAELLRINMQLVGLFGSAGVSTAGAVMATAQHLQKKMDFRCGREIAKCEYEPRHVCLSVCPLGSHWTDFHEILYVGVFRKFVEKIQVSLKSAPNSGTLDADRYTVMVTSRSDLLGMRNVADKTGVDNRNTNIAFSNFSPKSDFDGICGKILYIEQDRPHVTMWRMCIACWVIKATNTPTEYVILFAFPPKQCLNERASLLL